MEGAVTKEKKEKIILEVKYKELLWNKEDINYKNAELRKAMWALIGETVHLSGDRVQTVWNNLKDTRVRKIREDRDDPTLRRMATWEFTSSLSFLPPPKIPVKKPAAASCSDDYPKPGRKRPEEIVVDELHNAKKKKMEADSKSEEVADKYWLLSLLPNLKRMPQDKKIKMKLKIQKLLS